MNNLSLVEWELHPDHALTYSPLCSVRRSWRDRIFPSFDCMRTILWGDIHQLLFSHLRREGAISVAFVRPSIRPSVCPSVANNWRTQRPSVPKFGRKVPHLRCDSRTSLNLCIFIHHQDGSTVYKDSSIYNLTNVKRSKVLAFHGNYGLIFCHFWNKSIYWSKIAIFFIICLMCGNLVSVSFLYLTVSVINVWLLLSTM